MNVHSMPARIRQSMRRIVVIAFALFAGALLVSCGKAPKQTLHLNLVPGNTYVLSISITTDAVLTGSDGNNVPVPTSSLNTFILRPGEPDEHSDLSVSVEVGETQFPIMFVPLAKIVQGYNFGIKLSPVGSITEFVGTDIMRSRIRSSLMSLGASENAYELTSADRALASISDDSLRALIEPVTSIWPEVPVARGDEWAGPEVRIPYGDIVTATRYRLESSSNSQVKISFELEVRPAGSANHDTNLFPLFGEPSGRGTGEIRIDPVLGTIRSYKLNQEVNATLGAGTAQEFKLFEKKRIQAELIAR